MVGAQMASSVCAGPRKDELPLRTLGPRYTSGARVCTWFPLRGETGGAVNKHNVKHSIWFWGRFLSRLRTKSGTRWQNTPTVEKITFRSVPDRPKHDFSLFLGFMVFLGGIL
jgi:hypothetical protein